MPYTFRLERVGALRVSEVLRQTNLSDVEFHEDAETPQSDQWPLGLSLLYRKSVSVRRVQVNYSPELLTIEVFTASSMDDFDLAVRLAASVAACTGALIEDDNSPRKMDLDSFLEERDPDWTARMSYQGFAKFLNELIQVSEQRPGFSLVINGVNRPFTVGPRTLAALLDKPESAQAELYARVRRLNYIDEFEPEVFSAAFLSMGITLVSGEEKKVVLMTYPEGCRGLLNREADYIAIFGSDNQHVEIPTDRLIQRLESSLEWLDENYFIAPVLDNQILDSLIDEFKGSSFSYKEIPKISSAPPIDKLRIVLRKESQRTGISRIELEGICSILCVEEDGGVVRGITQEEVALLGRSLDDLFTIASANSARDALSSAGMHISEISFEVSQGQEVRIFGPTSDPFGSTIALNLERVSKFRFVGKHGSLVTLPTASSCYILPLEGSFSLDGVPGFRSFCMNSITGDEKPLVPFIYWYHGNFGYRRLQTIGEREIELPKQLQLLLAGQEAEEEGIGRPIGPIPRSLEGFSDTELHALMIAPVLVFFLVAAADGRVDSKEQASFSSTLTGDLTHQPLFFQEVVSLTLLNLGRCMEIVAAMAREGSLIELAGASFKVGIKAVAARHSRSTADNFKDALIELGEQIAGASGGILGIFGARISKNERAVLNTLRMLFEGI